MGKTQQGFTVVELMIGVAIMGVLTSLAVPTFNGYKYKARLTEAKTSLASLFKGEAALYQLGQSTGQKWANGCSGPMDAGGELITPTENAIVFDFGSVAACQELGFDLNAPTYFGYWALNPGPLGGGGFMYINTAYHDLDGDGVLGMLIENVGVYNGELSRMSRKSAGDTNLDDLIIKAL